MTFEERLLLIATLMSGYWVEIFDKYGAEKWCAPLKFFVGIF